MAADHRERGVACVVIRPLRELVAPLHIVLPCHLQPGQGRPVPWPSRRVGWATGAMFASAAARGGHPFGVSERTVDEFARGLRHLVVEEFPVDHHHRCVITRQRVAIRGPTPSGGGFVVADAEMLLRRSNGVAAHLTAPQQRVRAHTPPGMTLIGAPATHGVRSWPPPTPGQSARWRRAANRAGVR